MKAEVKVKGSKRKTLMNTKKDETPVKGLNGAGKEIQEMWHKIDGTQIDDLEKYIYDYLATTDKYDVMKIMIGTDGLEHGVSKNTRKVKLLTVICFHKVGKGAHVIKRKEEHIFNRRVDIVEKLSMEVYRTLAIVQYLVGIGIKPIVHLDLNPDPMHESNAVYNMFKGMFEALGCETAYKPDSPASSFAADYFL